MLELLVPESCIICDEQSTVNRNGICFRCSYDFEKLVLTESELQVNPGIVDNLKNHFQNVYSLYFFLKNLKVQRLVHQIKYNGKKELAVEFGKKLGKVIKMREWKVEAVIPVPMHPKKIKKRGYNQALLIAEGVAGELSVPILDNVLIKYKNTITQTKLSKFSRIQNSMDVFGTQIQNLQESNLLLIDDVVTTGSTLIACANRLKSIQGVKNISVATLAMARN